MAIPMYERQGTARGLPDVGVRPAGDGGAVALWGQAGQFAGQLRAKAEEFEDAETLEVYNAFQREVETYHSDPDKGVYNTKLGKDAAEVANVADLQIDNLMFKYGGGLKSPRARQNFARLAGQEKERRYAANTKFEAKQIEAFRGAEADATISSALDRIGASYADEAVVEAERAQMYQALELKLRGLGPEARAAAVQEMEDRIGGTRVVVMIREDPFQAEAWFKQNRDSFSSAMQQKVEDAIKEETDKRIVVGATDQLWATYGMDEAGAREAIYASDLEDDQKDKVWARLQARVQDERRFESQEETDWYNQWYERLGQASSLEEAVAMIEQSGATGKHKIDLMGMAGQTFAGRSGKGAKPEDDMGSYLEAYEKIQRGEIRDPAQLVQEYGAVLTEDTIKTMSKAIIDGTIRDENAAAGGNSDVGEIMKKAGIKTPQERARFLHVYSGEVMKAQEAKGKPLTQAEKLVIAENLAKKDVTLKKDWALDGKTYRYVEEEMRQIGAEWDAALKKYVIRDGEGNIVEIIEPKQQDGAVQFSGQYYAPNRTTGEGIDAAQAGVMAEYGNRADGTPKGRGYFGPLMMTDGSGQVMTELSIGVEIDGQETEIPLLVPTLTAAEVDALRAGKEPTAAMEQKAGDYAMERKEQGLPYFARDGEQVPLPERKFDDLPPGAPPTGRAQGTGTRVPAKQMSGNQGQFVSAIAPAAQRVGASTGVFPSIIIAQAGLESGWGKSSIGNNYFGIKANKNWKGATKSVRTHEYVNGKRVNVTAAFRDYGSIDESIADHSKLLTGKRYAKVLAARDYREAAQALQAAGYATDPKYAQKLIQIIEQFGLDKYDAV